MTEADDLEPQDFKLALADKRFLYKSEDTSAEEKSKLQKEILEVLFTENLAPLYEQVCAELGWTVDKAKFDSMTEVNEKTLKELEDKIKDAEENLGETEVREALLAKANYLCKLGLREKAAEAYKVTEEKTAGVGLKLDVIFSLLRLDIAIGDWHAVKKGLARAKVLVDEGGDWERKNKLKVYQSLFCVATRDFKGAASLFLDSIATFTASELFPYETSIFYTVLMAVVTLERPELKEKVVAAPEILIVIDSVPNLAPFLTSLYTCKYADFFKAFSAITESVRRDRYLAPHLHYYVREVRVVAYAQFLESYKSVKLENMAAQFGVSEDFMDRELASFIVSGRLTAKIDKVAGVVETNRPDAKNAQYQQTIKHGDLLLNRLQKLSKVIDYE